MRYESFINFDLTKKKVCLFNNTQSCKAVIAFQFAKGRRTFAIKLPIDKEDKSGWKYIINQTTQLLLRRNL